MHGETDRCKHGLIKAYCALCIELTEKEKVDRAVNRLVDRIDNLGGKVMSTNMKICKSGTDCVNGPDPQPIDNFQKSAVVPCGRLSTCKACMKKRMAAGRRKAADKRAEKANSKISYQKSERAGKTSKLELDFSGREQLLAELEKVAAKNFRDTKQQAMYYISSGVDGGNWMPERTAD